MDKPTRETVLLAALFFAAFAIRAFPVDTSYFFWDEAVYLLNAQHYAGLSPGYSELDVRPPLVPWLLSMLYRLGMDAETGSRLVMALLNSMFVPLLFLFGRLHNKKTAWIAAIFAAFFPYHIMSSRWIMTDALAAMLSATALYAAVRGLQSVRHKRHASMFFFISGIIAAASILAKFTSVLIVPVVLAALAIYWPSRTQVIALAGVFFLGLLIALLPYFLYINSAFGSPFYSIMSAFHVVKESEPAGFGYTLFSILDFFGIALLLAAIAFGSWIASNFSRKKDMQRRLQYLLIFWFGLMLCYYLVILQRGVSKPPTIEWEAERFLLPALAPAVIAASMLLARMRQHFAAILIMGFILLQPSALVRPYVPAIEYENGLRSVTKNVAEYSAMVLQQDEEIYCTLNCPVISYYSGKKIFYTTQSIEVPKGKYLIIFKNIYSDIGRDGYSGKSELYKDKSGDWVGLLLAS